MEYLLRNIACNLKNLRTEKKMSLEAVSEQTGVSRSMLAQIEREEANPSIGTLGKIASGLRIELKDLIATPGEGCYHLRADEMTQTKYEPGKYEVYTCFPFGENQHFEIYKIVVLPGGIYPSGAHGENTREYIYVEEGTLTLVTDGKEHRVHKGDMFRFETNKPHDYKNEGRTRVSLILVFSFA